MNDKIVVFGQSNYRFDIPKSHIIAVGRNVTLDMDFPEIFKYQVDRNAPLPTGEPVEKLIEEAYSPRGYKESKEKKEYRSTLTTSGLVNPSQDKKKEKTISATKPVLNMIIGGNHNHSENILSLAGVREVIVDAETLVAQTQNRVGKALKGRYKYDSSLKDSQGFF
jgi:hypothetical protein